MSVFDSPEVKDVEATNLILCANKSRQDESTSTLSESRFGVDLSGVKSCAHVTCATTQITFSGDGSVISQPELGSFYDELEYSSDMMIGVEL